MKFVQNDENSFALSKEWRNIKKYVIIISVCVYKCTKFFKFVYFYYKIQNIKEVYT